MISYLEDVLGLYDGALSGELGTILCTMIVLVGFFAICKVIIVWIQTIFNGG